MRTRSLLPVCLLIATLLPGIARAEATTTTVDGLLEELSGLVAEIGASEATRADYDAFVARNDLAASDALYADFVRVKIAFEATRAGGLWGLQWNITDREPESDAIWAAWRRIDGGRPKQPTAVAECDELSALFAFVARRMGVGDIGLFWPVWNHVVAVWTLKDADGGKVRVILPTSQIFLEPEETFDTRGFDPWTQRTIYTYAREDIAGDVALPATLVQWFVAQVRAYAPASTGTLQQIRNLRELRLAGLADRDDVARFAKARVDEQGLGEHDRAAWGRFVEELR
jgi:hypothetical protein